MVNVMSDYQWTAQDLNWIKPVVIGYLDQEGTPQQVVCSMTYNIETGRVSGRIFETMARGGGQAVNFDCRMNQLTSIDLFNGSSLELAAMNTEVYQRRLVPLPFSQEADTEAAPAPPRTRRNRQSDAYQPTFRPGRQANLVLNGTRTTVEIARVLSDNLVQINLISPVGPPRLLNPNSLDWEWF